MVRLWWIAMVSRSIGLVCFASCFLVSSAAAINPCEVATLAKPDGANGFGGSTGISGDWIVMGASSEGFNNSVGAAYFFRRQGDQWIQHQRVQGSEITFDSDKFGAAVAIDGEWAVISAPYGSPAGPQNGHVYVYRFNGTDWVEHSILTSSIPSFGDAFGQSLDLEGGVIAAGAPGAASFDGRVFVFRFDGTDWVEEAALSRVATGPEGNFAWASLAISGNRIVAGDLSDSTTVFEQGAVFVFSFDGNSWSQEAKLVANDPATVGLGDEVAIDGTLIVAGGSGVAYLFVFETGAWTQSTKLSTGLSSVDQNFGKFVIAGKDLALVVGSPGVFVYEKTGTLWSRTAIATSSSGTSHGHLSADGDLFVSRTVIFNILGGPLCIPTLSEWGAIALFLLLASAAVVVLRTRGSTCLTTFTALASLSIGTVARAGHPALAPPHHPQNLIVRFVSDTSEASRASIITGHGASELHRISCVSGLTIVRAPATSLEYVMVALRANLNVAYAEPDYFIEGQVTIPDDYNFYSMWGMDAIRAPQGWDIWTGDQEFLIAVLDTGIDLGDDFPEIINDPHPDLLANLWTNPNEIADNGIDEDGNGYIDDVHGYDFATNPDDGDPRHVEAEPGITPAGHGSHVSGTLGAVANNGIGVPGAG
jgi:FG-GAP repeat/Subtilase family